MEINKIYCENCLDTMKRMDNDFVDISITSPPYNISTDRIYKYNGDYNDSLSVDEYFQFSKNVISELIRVTRNYVFYNIQMVSGNKVALFKLIGAFANNLKEVIIWDKLTAEPAISEKVLNSQFEFILVFAKDSSKRYFEHSFFSRGTESNVIMQSKKTDKDYLQKEHKAVFPLNIPGKLINNFSQENEIIYDPFIGTGTTAEASIILKRNWIGTEISQEYTDLANKRLWQYLNQKTLF